MMWLCARHYCTMICSSAGEPAAALRHMRYK